MSHSTAIKKVCKTNPGPLSYNFPALHTYLLTPHSLTYLLTYLLTCLLTHLLTHLFTYLLTYSLTASLTHLLACLLTYLLTYLFTYWLTHLLTCLLTYLLTYLLTHSLNCLLTYLLTYSLTPWYKVLIEKLIGLQLVKKFHGTRRFITALTSACHLSLSWASSIQSIPLKSHFLKIHLNIIFPSTHGSSKWPLSLRFPHQIPVYTSPPTHMRYMLHPSQLSCINLIIIKFKLIST